MESPINIQDRVFINMEQHSDKEDKERQESYVCSISLIIMLHPMRTPCNHIFEEICINHWLKSNSSCPIDRHVITKAELKLDVHLQKEIADYLDKHPSLKKSALKDYQDLIDQYYSKKEGVGAYFKTLWKKLAGENWRVTLYRTHRIALVCLVMSASTFLIANFFDEKPISPEALINDSFYLMIGSGAATAITSESFLHRWNTLQDRRVRPPRS